MNVGVTQMYHVHTALNMQRHIVCQRVYWYLCRGESMTHVNVYILNIEVIKYICIAITHISGVHQSSRRPVPSDVLHSIANTSMRLLESGRQNTKQPTHKVLSTGRQYILSLAISCIPLCAVM